MTQTQFANMLWKMNSNIILQKVFKTMVSKHSPVTVHVVASFLSTKNTLSLSTKNGKTNVNLLTHSVEQYEEDDDDEIYKWLM